MSLLIHVISRQFATTPNDEYECPLLASCKASLFHHYL